MNVNSIYSEQLFNLNDNPGTPNITNFEGGGPKRVRGSSNAEPKSSTNKGERIKISLNKIPFKPNGFKAKGQVSIDISSIQSPEHKAIYQVDNISIQHKNEGSNSSNPKEYISLDNLSLKENSTSLEKHNSNEIVFDFNSHKKQKLSELLKNPSSNNNQGLMMEFLRTRIGQEAFEAMIESIDNSENPIDFINNSDYLKTLLGKDYNHAASIIKLVLNNNKTPNSSASFSTKYSLSNIN